jgi:cysteinyl-tRNA synthetase
MVSIKLILKAVAPTISLMILIALNGIGSAQVVEKNSEDLINEAIILNGEIINHNEQYKNIFEASKPEIMRAMAKDPVLVLNGARLLGKYSPAIENFNQGKNDGNLITKQDVKEIVSFSNRLEKRIMEDRDKRGIKSSKKSIECLDEFRKEVEKSKGKTFGDAFRDSIYYKD